MKHQDSLLIEQSFSIEQYIEQIERKIINFSVNENNSIELANSLKIWKAGLDRMNNTFKSYTPGNVIQNIISASPGLQWHVIMEDWCSTSTLNVPYVIKIAKIDPTNTITIIPRDTNNDYMNNFLTNGKEIIPKIIVFDKTGNQLFEWGPSSNNEILFQRYLKQKELAKEEYRELYIKWIKENLADAIEQDFINLFTNN